ncbi:MAG TPA: BamA/TamA family outer membrane protein [Armatimonadota bacterium]|nr:BamA/TamA family outer membrane protein [Armatimonadota bacterium]
MRMRGMLLICLILSTVLVVPARAATLPPEGAPVVSVNVRGNQQISREAILSAVSARPGQTITTAQLEKDVEALRKLGYFQEVLAPEVALSSAGASIVYVVREFPAIRAVEFTGNTVFTSDQLRAILALPPGAVFNREVLTRRMSEIESAYRAHSYVARVVVADVRISPEGILTIPIHEARVTTLTLIGLQRVRESVIRRGLVLQPGMLFDERELRRDFNRLQQLNLFETVDPTVDFNAAGDVDITWTFKEGRTRALNFGLSYGSPEGLVGSVAFSENNFRGRAEQLSLMLNISSVDARMGGELAYARPLMGKSIAYNARSYSLIDYRFSEELISQASVNVDHYFERHNGVQVGASRDLGRNRVLSAGARYENVFVFNLPPEFLTTDIPSLNSELIAGNGDLVRDRRDYLLYPTTGDFADLGATVGVASRGSDEHGGGIMKGQMDWRFYIPVFTSGPLPQKQEDRLHIPVLATRVMVGSTAGDLPFFEQFFVGGANTIRGYLEDRYWGEHMVVASAELRWPLPLNLIGAAFVDGGSAWHTDFQFINTGTFSTEFRQSQTFFFALGAGVGIRYLSPLGVLRLDFAYGDHFRTHFTLGQPF